MKRRELGALLAIATACGAMLPSACASDDGNLAANAPTSETPEPGGSSGGNGAFADAATSCVDGETCGDGGVCTGNVCCAPELVCGSVCCAGGQVCSFGQCLQPGAKCTDSSDCPGGQYCEYALGDAPGGSGGTPDAGGPDGGACVGGSAVVTGRCLLSPPICPPGEPNPGTTCLEKCEVVPPTIAFDPVVKYSWGGETTPPYASDVMMTPIVVQLDDDNCDGKINGEDIPEIVFATFSGGGYYSVGTLHAIHVQDGQLVEKWSKPGAVHGTSGIAAGDLDGDGVPEIVACLPPAPGGASCCDEQARNTGVVAFKANGDVLWTQPDTTQVHCGYEYPAIADPDGTGPKVLVGLTLLDGKTGAVVKNLDPAQPAANLLTSFTDVDGDGKLDVVQGHRAFRTSGEPLWTLTVDDDQIGSGYHAVGDLDKDGKPEIIIVSVATHTIHVVRFDAASPKGVKVVRKGVDINNGISTASFCNAGNEYGGGPPVVSDFDGDGFPDVGVAGAVGYMVLSGKKLMDPNVANADTALWFKTTQDCSSASTGSSVFDFNGDGKAEVIYGDEVHLWMYDGATGASLIPETCNTSGTLMEYPVVADVDNDGQADIVVASNGYTLSCNGTKQSGIRVFGSASGSWVRTRRIWNQHTYHVTNVEESGAIPKNEIPNWTVPGLNSFRQNKQPGGEFSAPDAVVRVAPRCDGEPAVVATVQNLGQAVLPAGAIVTFHAGAPTSSVLLGEVKTTVALGPAQSSEVALSLANAPDGVKSGDTPVYAVVGVAAPTVECRSTNNTSPAVTVACASVK